MTWKQIARRDAIKVGKAIGGMTIGHQAMHDFETGHIMAGIGIAAVHLGLDLVGTVIGSSTISDFSSGNWKGGVTSLGITLGMDVVMVVVGSLTGGTGDVALKEGEEAVVKAGEEVAATGVARASNEGEEAGLRDLLTTRARDPGARNLEQFRAMSPDEIKDAMAQAEREMTPEQLQERDIGITQSRNDQAEYQEHGIQRQQQREEEALPRAQARELQRHIEDRAFHNMMNDLRYGLTGEQAQVNRDLFIQAIQPNDFA